MEENPLPPPLELSASCPDELVKTFRAFLTSARQSRGLPEPLTILFPDYLSKPPPPAPLEKTWIPHLVLWEEEQVVLLLWELIRLAALQSVLGTEPHDVIRWADRRDLLLRLGELALDGPDGRQADGHLSFRWLMAHQDEAARVLAAESVDLEHVSIHVAPEDEADVVRILTQGLGMVEIPRPGTIPTPGRWLQTGNARVHLSSREARPDEEGFPGTAPNHVCFAVEDIFATELELARLGVPTKHAGSLSTPQIWIRLRGGTAIELQARR